MTIECLGYRKHDSGALQGFGNFRMTQSNGLAFELFGCGVFMKDGRRWIAMPSREYQDPETHEKKYISIFRFCDKAHGDAFGHAALAALDSWCKSQNEAPAPEQASQTEGLPF